MTIRAVLFDVGGPLDTELIHERLWDAHIREAVTAEGFPVTDGAFAEANAYAVSSFAWNAYQAVVWRLTGGDPEASRRAYAAAAARGPERITARGGFELRDGIPDLLRRLGDRGLLLGLAANQPVAAIESLDRLGIGPYFHHREVSESHGFRKPDVRLFLRACDDLGVGPADCIMVGDRVDNDIVPAKWLGMRAVRLLTGRHSNQQSRSWSELPDAEVVDVESMGAAIYDLVVQSAGQ